MDTLFLHLACGTQERADAWLKSAGGLTSLGNNSIAELAAAHHGSRCIVFLSGSDCLLTSAAVSGKQLRQAGNALAWLVEEQVGEDVENLHVVAAPSATSGETALLVIARDSLAGLLASLRGAGLQVLAVLPDIVLLPYHDNTWQLSEWGNGGVALCTGELAGAVMEAGMMTTMLDAALEEKTAPASINVAVADAALRNRLEQWGAAHPDIELHFTDTFDSAVALDSGRDWTRHPANLLQGAFAVSESFRLPAGLRVAAGFMAVAFAVQLAGEWIRYAWYGHQASKLEVVATQQYQQLFPQADLPEKGRMAKIRKNMESHLAGNSSGTTVLSALTKVAESLQGSGLNTQRVDFSGGVLTLDVDARALGEIDGLKQKLDAQGFRSEIVSANAQNGLIRGRLKVEGGA